MKNLNFSLLLTALWALGLNAFAQGDIAWKSNFGGSGNDYYIMVTAVADGVVAAGYSGGESFGNGDWTGVTGNGSIDAVLVKYDNNGNIVWKRNFGGSGDDYFTSAITVSDGIIASGYSDGTSFGNGDWTGVNGKGGYDAILVKYDNSGNVVWKKNFGGSGNDMFLSVTATSDGFIAVGQSDSFGNGDWNGIEGKGGSDAILVKYDNNGNVVWEKNFGGNDNDDYRSATVVSDGIIAVGCSYGDSFGNGDWAGVTGKGGGDAILVKYDNNGNVVWKTNFGGNGTDDYRSITTVSDGVIAVGVSRDQSFGNGDWTGIAGHSINYGFDAIMVKYDNSGNVAWKTNFGGSSEDSFSYVTAVSDGIIVTGQSIIMGDGDWTGIVGHGSYDAIMVKYDYNGNVLEKTNFGGDDDDWFGRGVVAVPGGIVVIGYSYGGSFGNGDWTGVAGKGNWSGMLEHGDTDAIIVKYGADGTNIPQLTPPTSGLTIYPNPANDKAQIFVPASLASPTIRIFDMTGKIAAAYPCTGATTTVDVSHLQPGIYFVEVAGKTGKLLIKR